jgi:leader peptidase (prepilin peptidase) / N-methyltransferase
MAWLLTVPLEGRLAVVACVGLLLGAFVNWATYAWSWGQPRISPWQVAPEGVRPRNWLDRLPLIGWLRLARDAAVVGRGFWIRPLIVELASAAGLAALYWWEVDQLGLLRNQAPLPALNLTQLAFALHWQFFAHTLLATLMLIASLIDIDETFIPDEVTVFGALIGLSLSAISPLMHLPNLEERGFNPAAGAQLVAANGRPVFRLDGLPIWLEPTHIAAPADWPIALNGAAALMLGLAIYLAWCLSITTRIWRPRHSWARNFQVLTGRMRKELTTRPLREITLIGLTAIVSVWWWGHSNWVGLLTALVGLAVSGGYVWGVRLISRVTLKREAMGFGDVTLMFMIGTFVGWQTGLMIFWLAPLTAVLIGIAQLVLRGEKAIPFGPFLCLATLLLVVRWPDVWNSVESAFYFPKLIPGIALVSLPLMGVLLFTWQIIKQLLFGSQPEES